MTSTITFALYTFNAHWNDEGDSCAQPLCEKRVIQLIYYNEYLLKTEDNATISLANIDEKEIWIGVFYRD